MQTQNFENTPITILIEAMGKLSSEVDTGYFIAKQSIIINSLQFNKNDMTVKAYIEKTKETLHINYIKSNCEVSYMGEKLIELKTTLIKKKHNGRKEKFSNTNANYISSANKCFFRNITKDEVYKFSSISGDPNYIHKGDNPVVQAMFILLLLEDYLCFKGIYMENCEITYVNPILTDQDIFLCWQGEKILLGIVNDKVCFKLIFK